MVQTERVVVFGGTGNIGRIIVQKLLSRGCNVDVFTRQNQYDVPGANIVVGNVLDEQEVEACLSDGCLVVVALGFTMSSEDTMSRGTANIISAMQKKNLRRMLCLSAQGAGDSWDHMPPFFHEMVRNDKVLSASFKDHTLQEKIVKDSTLDWTIVRPTEVMDSEETGLYDIGYPSESSRFQISKYDIAQFMIEELFNGNHVHSTVLITS